VQAGILIYGKRKVKFSPDLESIYHNMFRNHLTRAEFQKLTKNKIFERVVKPGIKPGYMTHKKDELLQSLVIIAPLLA
jgi:hypothetical protein